MRKISFLTVIAQVSCPFQQRHKWYNDKSLYVSAEVLSTNVLIGDTEISKRIL